MFCKDYLVFSRFPYDGREAYLLRCLLSRSPSGEFLIILMKISGLLHAHAPHACVSLAHIPANVSRRMARLLYGRRAAHLEIVPHTNHKDTG